MKNPRHFTRTCDFYRVVRAGRNTMYFFGPGNRDVLSGRYPQASGCDPTSVMRLSEPRINDVSVDEINRLRNQHFPMGGPISP